MPEGGLQYARQKSSQRHSSGSPRDVKLSLQPWPLNLSQTHLEEQDGIESEDFADTVTGHLHLVTKANKWKRAEGQTVSLNWRLHIEFTGPLTPEGCPSKTVQSQRTHKAISEYKYPPWLVWEVKLG